MPANNNQKMMNAAARLARLPVVRSAFESLPSLYNEAKCSSPSLNRLCQMLENGASAAHEGVSPVILRLEPQISLANDVACKGLDWLEDSFPALLLPTDQVVSSVKNKLLEIQEVVIIAAGGSVACIEHTVSLAISRLTASEGLSQSVAERALSLVKMGLGLSVSLMDKMLPATKKKEENSLKVEGFEGISQVAQQPFRMFSITTEPHKKTCHLFICKLQSFQDRCSILEDMAGNLQELSQYMQHLAIRAFFFITQFHNAGHSPSRQKLTLDKSHSAVMSKPLKGVVLSKSKPLRMRPAHVNMHCNRC